MHPLHPDQYPRIRTLLQQAPINTLFAQAVVARHVAGSVYVDDPTAPRRAYVAHPYGMSLLVGEAPDSDVVAWLLAGRSGGSALSSEWLQAWPQAWNVTLERVLGERLVSASTVPAGDALAGCAVRHVRVNFRFRRERFEQIRERLIAPHGATIIDDAVRIFSEMDGSVVPRMFWNSARDFAARGAACAVVVGGEIAAAAFAAFVIGDHLELGVETRAAYRGTGLAASACAALIACCLERGLEPVWSCRLDNRASYRLAQRLGFEPIRQIPYFRLPRRGG